MSSVRGHADFRAVVRTSEPVAHKPLGAGSSVVSSKDFQPQLKQRHVLICTDNMSVFSYIITKEEYDPTSMQRISCYVRTVTFSQSEQRTSPVRGSGGGSVRHELENAHCLLFVSLSHSPLKGDALTSHWPAARLYIKNKIKRCFGDTHRPELAEPAWFPDRTELLVAPLADPRQEGSAISDERFGVAPEPGVVEPSCVAASEISEELSALHSRVLDTLSRRGNHLRGVCML